MTRINVGVKPEELPDKLLLAEHREITRIPNAIKSGRAILSNIPAAFTLGTGHVKFFYNRLAYLSHRYEALYAECCKRDFNVTYKGEAFELLPISLWKGYLEKDVDRKMIVERIKSKGFTLLT